jgi:CheY-like chemotaxis protein
MENMEQQVSGFVLVVDDDEGVRRVLARWAADMGYAVEAAADAESALDLMRQHQVDVALVDVRMPGHDGIWLLDQVRRLFPETATVLATGLMEMAVSHASTRRPVSSLAILTAPTTTRSATREPAPSSRIDPAIFGLARQAAA